MMMKKIALAAFTIFIFTSPAFGDDVDDGFGNMATTKLKAGARNMIRAGIEKEDAVGMTRAMLESRFKEENALRAQEIVMRALKEGLPPEAVMNKVYEGMAKRVKQENIIQAMEKVMSRYAFADQQAGEITQDKSQRQLLMQQIAKCAAAGVSEHDVGRLIYHLKFVVQEMPKNETDGLATETFRTTKEIARLHVLSMNATDVALEALKRRYGVEEMAKVRKTFIKHARDTSANTVAEGYLHAIRQGKRLENLDFSRMKSSGMSSGRGSSAVSGGASGGPGGAGGHGGGAGGGSGRGHGGS